MINVLDKRLIYTTEASAEWRLHADTIKRLTGSDKLSARMLYSSTFISKVPEFTPWIATNRAPTIQHADAALWRRLVVVPFTHQVAADAEDLTLKTQLRAEGAGVLRWAVEGWAAYARDGGLRIPAAVERAGVRLRRELSEVDAFLAEVCETGEDYSVSFAQLFAAYENWRFEERSPDQDALTRRRFAAELDARDIPKGKVRAGTGDTKVAVRLGLCIAGLDPNSRVRLKVVKGDA